MDELFRSYLVLGVRPGSTDEEIKKAYRRLAREWHPDRITDETKRRVAETKLREINHAYESLQSTPLALRPKSQHVSEKPASTPPYDTFTWHQAVAEQALADSPETDQAFYSRALQLHFDGMAHFRAARWRDAVSCLSQTVFMVRNNPHAWTTLGRCYRRLNQPQKAESAYKEAVRLCPDDLEAHLELGETYLALGDRTNAEREAKGVEAFDPDLASRLRK